MDFSDREIEAASDASERRQTAAIERIRAELTAEGEEECISCGQPIPEARRRAMPSAERCVACQTKFERTHL